jgi:hypothetical protein
MRLFDDLPWWARAPLSIGGVLMATFSKAFPIGFQTAGIYVGIALAIFGLAGTVWHFVKTQQLLSQWRLQWPLARRAPLLAPSVPLHMALHVGHFWVDFTQLKEKLRFGISFVLFNQTDKDIAIEGLRGGLVFERFTKMAAVLLEGNPPFTASARHHDGISITIWQSVTTEEKDRICEIFASGKEVIFSSTLLKSSFANMDARLMKL